MKLEETLDFFKYIRALERRIKALEQGKIVESLSLETSFKPPRLSSDPSAPDDGSFWYNTTSDVYKGRENGSTVTFTTT